MTREKALKLIELGYKITHRDFDKGEFIKKHKEGNYINQDGAIFNANQFWLIRKGEPWKNGYKIYESKKSTAQDVQNLHIPPKTRNNNSRKAYRNTELPYKGNFSHLP